MRVLLQFLRLLGLISFVILVPYAWADFSRSGVSVLDGDTSCESALLDFAITTISGMIPAALGIAQHSVAHYPAQSVMALRKQQACWGNPECMVDRLLTNAGSQHEADRCVLEYCENWVSSPPLTTREQGVV